MESIIYTQSVIPDVLLDFLYGLIHNDSAIKEIRLVPNTLGAGVVQDIIYETADGSVYRRVFGFPPVNAHLMVSHDAGRHALIAA